MKKIRTWISEGRKHRMMVILAGLLVVALAAVGSVTALGYTTSGRFYLKLKNQDVWEEDVYSQTFTSALGKEVGLSQAVTADNSNFSGVKAFVVKSTDMGRDTNLMLTLNQSEDELGWSISRTSGTTTITYRNPDDKSFTANDFAHLINSIAIVNNPAAPVSSAKGTVSIMGYARTTVNDNNLIARKRLHVVQYYNSRDEARNAYQANSNKNWDDETRIWGLNYMYDYSEQKYCTYYYDYMTSYEIKFVQYGYLSGSIMDGAQYKYKNGYADGYNTSYEESIDRKTPAQLLVSNADQGRFDFAIQLGDAKGTSINDVQYGYKASVGFQIKEEGSAWDNTIPKLWIKATDADGTTMKKLQDGTAPYFEVPQYIRTTNETEYYYYYDTYRSQWYRGTRYKTKTVGSPVYQIDLTDPENANKVISLSLPDIMKVLDEAGITEKKGYIEKLTSGKTYVVRGLIATDGKLDSYLETNEVTFRYDPPVINNFKIGSTQVTYGNNVKTMDLSLQATFADTNANQVEKYAAYGKSDGVKEFSGPWVEASLYFTANRDVYDNGEDHSTWVKFTGNQMKIDGITPKTQKNDQGEDVPMKVTQRVSMNGETAVTIDWDDFRLPETLHDVDENNSSTVKINSANCAFKLVLTDLYTGYSTSYITGTPFSIDAEKPTAPGIYARDDMKGPRTSAEALTDAMKLTIDREGGPKIVGGANSSVVLYVDGSTDVASNIREYQYAMYFLPSSATSGATANPLFAGKTTQQILRMLEEQVFTTALGPTSGTVHAYKPDGTRDTEAYDLQGNLSSIQYSKWTATNNATDENGSILVDYNSTETKKTNVGQITVNKDGYYFIKVRAIDEAEWISDESKAFFRVDLTPPSTPQVKLVKVIEGGYQEYDNSVYSDANVVMLVNSPALTGKTLKDFEFTTDGGLTWNGMLAWKQLKNDSNAVIGYEAPKVNGITVWSQIPESVQTQINAWYKERYNVDPPAVPTPVWASDDHTKAPLYDYYPINTTITLTGVKKISGEGTVSIDYQMAVNLTGLGYNDYTSVQVKAKDTLNNESVVSDAVVMRTTAQEIKPSATMTHDTIEVALAIGNTGVDVDNITRDVKNAGAQKINKKYYWSKTAADAGLSDTPTDAQILTALTEKLEPSSTAVTKGEINTALASAAAQNKYVDFNGYGPYISAGLLKEIAEDGSTVEKANFKKAFNPYVYVATYGMRDATHSKSVKADEATEVAPGTADSVIPHKCSWGTDPACAGVCQDTDCAYAKLEALGYSPYKPELINVSGMSAGDATVGMDWYHFDHRDNYSNTTNGTVPYRYDTANHGSTPIGVGAANKTNPYYNTKTGLYTAASHWVTNTSVNVNSTIGANNDYSLDSVTPHNPATTHDMRGRPMHIVAYADTSDTAAYNSEDDSTFKMDNIRTYGYFCGAPKDWMMLYVDNPAKKNIAFTISDFALATHSNDGYGFFFNTTQRQNSAGTWVISGYLFYIFNKEHPSTTNGCRYTWSISRIEDMPMARMMRVNPTSSQDTVAKSDNLGAKIIMSTTDQGIKRLWWYTSTLYGPNGNDGTMTRGIRHFRLVMSGSTTKIYVWQETTTNNSTKNAEDLEEKFNKDTNNGKTNGVQTMTAQQSPDGKAKTAFVSGFTAINFTVGTPTVAIANQAATGNEDYRMFVVTDTTDEKFDGCALYTPRPKVDGETIGWTGGKNDVGKVEKKATTHTDTNCFGFGLIAGANGYSHGCRMETQIVFSNLILKLTNTKKLSEVVTEPSWGNGKAKFIANISDDAEADFKDPVMNSQIQWRLNNDQAKYVGWGKIANRQDNVNFIASMAGGTDEASLSKVGMYQISDYTTTVEANQNDGTEVSYTTQVDNVATYITERYFAEFGYDPTNTTSIQDQLSDPSSGVAKGTVYDANDVDNIVFNVDPAEYKKSSANPDFPAGRWYMVHDVAGYTDTSGRLVKSLANGNAVSYAAELDPRSGSFSDALETNVSLPGRYTYYFAPDRLKNSAGEFTTQADPDKLDPANAKFSFVVNTAPVARFTAQVNNNTNQLDIQDNSYDPDARSNNYVVTAQDANTAYSSVSGYTAISGGKDKAGNAVGSLEDVRLNGIEKWEWRYELLVPASKQAVYTRTSDNGTVTETDTLDANQPVLSVIEDNETVQRKYVIDPDGTELLTLLSTDWSQGTTALASSPNGKTLAQLVEAAPATVTGNETPVNLEKSSVEWLLKNIKGDEPKMELESIPNYSALPEKAVLNVYLRVTDTSAYEVSKGVYQTCPNAGKVSTVTQVNVSNGSDEIEITNPASASMGLNKMSMYDTAISSPDNSNKTIEIERTSSHSNPNQKYALVWKIGRGSSKDYTTLIRRGSNFYLKVSTSDGFRVWNGSSYDASQAFNAEYAAGLAQTAYDTEGSDKTNTLIFSREGAGTEASPYKYYMFVPVLTNKVTDDADRNFSMDTSNSVQLSGDEADTEYASTRGVWTLSYDFLNQYLAKYKDNASQGMILQINEVVYGYSAEKVAMSRSNENELAVEDKEAIVNSSSRTVYYKTDKNAPSSQVVLTEQLETTKPSNGPFEGAVTTETIKSTETYKASQYLDVTDNNRFIRVTLSGTADLEGVAKGFGYYFYRKSAGVESKWYSLTAINGTGRLVEVKPKEAMYTLTADDAKYYLVRDTTTNEGKYSFGEGTSKKEFDKRYETAYNAGSWTGVTDVDTNQSGVQVKMIDHVLRVQYYNQMDAKYRAANETAYRNAVKDAGENAILEAGRRATEYYFMDGLSTYMGSAEDPNQYRKAATILVGENLAMEGNGQKLEITQADLVNAANDTSKVSKTLIFGRSAMETTPTDELNLAFFAYDAQTTRDDTPSRANQSTETRLEGIKLSVSNPMPPEIMVKDESNQTVAYIGNALGYTEKPDEDGDNGTKYQTNLKTALGEDAYEDLVALRAQRDAAIETDPTYDPTRSSETEFFSKTGVLISFIPKVGKFKEVDNQTTGGKMLERQLGEVYGAQDYYEDIYAAADLTGTAKVKYSAKFWAPDMDPDKDKPIDNKEILMDPPEPEDSGEDGDEDEPAADPDSNVVHYHFTKAEADQITKGTEMLEVPNSTSLSFTQDGIYEITALIRNGSGTESVTRTVRFTIDKTSPIGMTVVAKKDNGGGLEAYGEGEWAKQVVLEISGATDLNKKDYEFSLDNGKEFKRLDSIPDSGMVELSIPGEVNGKPILSGTHSVVIRAIDKAGNYQTWDPISVKVDKTPPKAEADNVLELTATSSSTPLYDSHVINVVTKAHGSVSYIRNNLESAPVQNPILDVNNNGSLTLKFIPEDGYQVGTVTDNRKEVNTAQVGSTSARSYELTNVNTDHNIVVTFVDPNAASLMSERTFRSVELGDKAARLLGTMNLLGDNSSDGDGDSSDSDEGDSRDDDSGNQEEPVVEKEMVTVSYGRDPAADQGTITVTNLVNDEVAINSTVTVELRPNSGYTVKQAVVTVSGNGSTITPQDMIKTTDNGQAVYKFDLVIDGYTQIVASFEKNKRQVNITEVEPDVGAVTLTEVEGKVVKDGSSYTVQVGESVTIKLSAKPGYEPTKLTLTGATFTDKSTEIVPAQDATSIDDTQTMIVPDGDSPVTVTAEFEPVEKGYDYPIPVRVIVVGKGKVTPGPSDQDTVVGGTALQKDIMVAADKNRTFTFEPAEHYVLEKVELSVHVDEYEFPLKGTPGTPSEVTTQLVSGDTRSYVFNKSYAATMEVTFVQKKHKITLDYNTGGNITASIPGDDEEWVVLSHDQMEAGVAEGTPVRIELSVDDNYRLYSMDINHNGSNILKDIGKVSSIDIPSLNGKLEVEANFRQRSVDRISTDHKITAIANDVTDDGSGLAPEGFQFAIRKGTIDPAHVQKKIASYVEDWQKESTYNYDAWTDWTMPSASNMVVFEGKCVPVNGVMQALEPNQAYTVYMRAIDRVGNVSQPKRATVVTMANMATVGLAANRNDEGETSTKSVDLQVRINGNPDMTEYRVYHSTEPSMRDPAIATLAEDKDGDGWATLGDSQTLQVTGLNPGNRYYLQVESRNHSGKVTPRDPNDFTDILLSPAAPPKGSLYFQLQPDPTGTITLKWDDPSGDVMAVQIYVNDEYLCSVPKGTNEYQVEPELLQADKQMKFSYAYENTAGVGSSQAAVSEQYYQAMKNADKTILNSMTAMETGSNRQLFTEAMTYPIYPLELEPKNISAGSQGSGTGNLTVTMHVDTTKMNYQQYVLYLRAYEPKMVQDTDELGNPKVDGNGDPVMVQEIEDGKKVYDETKEVTIEGFTGPENAKETEIDTSLSSTETYSAHYTWSGLPNQYGYKVYVKEVRSTPVNSHGAQSSNVGVQGYLGLNFFVNSQGYGYSYNDTGHSIGLTDKALTEWTEKAKAAYIGTQDAWESPIYPETISFNETPYIKLAEDVFEGNDPSRIKTDSQGQYLVINRDEVNNSKDGLNFYINAVAWDKDISMSPGPFYIRGELDMQPGEASMDDHPLAASETEAEKKPYLVQFNAQGLTTGVYGKLNDGESTIRLRVYDGVTEGHTPETSQVRVVMNMNKPLGSLKHSSTQYVQRDLPIDLATFAEATTQITASPELAEDSLAEVALILMAQQYQDAGFAVTEYQPLYDYLVEGLETNGFTAQDLETSKAAALSLLGEDKKKDSEYFNQTTQRFTKKGFKVAVLSVAPPVERYILLGTDFPGYTQRELAMNSLTSAGVANPGQYLLTDTGLGGKAYYWMELNKALQYGYCDWLQYAQGDNTKIVPTIPNEDFSDTGVLTTDDRNNTRSMKLVAYFGGNTKVMNLNVIVRKAPSVEILSNKRFGWTDVGIDEYKYFAANGNKNATIPELKTVQSQYTINKMLEDAKFVYNRHTEFVGLMVPEENWVTDSSGVEYATKFVTDTEHYGTSDRVNPEAQAFRVAKIKDDQGEDQEPQFLTVDQFVDEYARDSETDHYRFQVYKLVDSNGTVTTKTLAIQLGTYQGIHEIDLHHRMKKIGVVVSQEQTWRPTNDVLDTGKAVFANVDGKVGNPVKTDGNYIVSIAGLTENTKYYLWPFYQLDDDTTVRYGTHYVAFTTKSSFPTAYYGFTTAKDSYREEKQSQNKDDVTHYGITVIREDDPETPPAYGEIQITPTYYLADEFGNLLYTKTDDSMVQGDLIQLTDVQEEVTYQVQTDDGSEETVTIKPGEMRTAINALSLAFAGDSPYELHTVEDPESEKTYTVTTPKAMRLEIPASNLAPTFDVRVKNNGDLFQHHLVLRLTMTVVKHKSGFCQLASGLSEMNIFLRDDEDKITTFKMNVTGTGAYLKNDGQINNTVMTDITPAAEAANKHEGTQWNYQFDGLQVGYQRFGSLTIKYANKGTGNLEGIRAKVFELEADGVTPSETESTEFRVGDMSTNELLQGLDVIGEMEVYPVSNLKDGIHKAVLVIWTPTMDEEDYIRVYLTQVVGQSTLKGKIRITNRDAREGEKTGVATVIIYRTADVIGSGSGQVKTPFAQVQTNEYGVFEIPNILNNDRYHIRVERDGFVAYDSALNGGGVVPLKIGDASQDYVLEMQLYGGDVNGDGFIDTDDLEMLKQNYAKYASHYEDADEETKQVLARCDFNGDGVVNAIDLAYLNGNLKFRRYTYVTLTGTDR